MFKINEYKTKVDSLHDDNVANIHDNQYQTLPPADTEKKKYNHVSAFNQSE